MKIKLHFVISLIIVFSCLVGCIPVAFVAGAGATGAFIYEKRGLNTMIKDRDMANAALHRIENDRELREQTHITVAAFNHVMLMVGQAPTEQLRAKAYRLVGATPNLKRIYNVVTIEPPLSKAEIAKDSWITTVVKSALVAEKGINANQIKVVTENRVVYLLGIVTRKQADIAADVTSRIKGVARVVKLFEYEL